mgnify:CR=1 FL=1
MGANNTGNKRSGKLVILTAFITQKQMKKKILNSSYTHFEELEIDLQNIPERYIFSIDTPFGCRVFISKDEAKAVFLTKDHQRFERVFIDEDIEELLSEENVTLTRIIHLSVDGRPDYWN